MLFNALKKMMNDQPIQLPKFEVKKVEHKDRSKASEQTVDWGLEALNVCETWKETRGEGIRVAVLDTGITNIHDDLTMSVIKSKNFTSRYEDETHDYVGHGTHCAGIIRATDNNFGVVGVAPGCQLLIGKVLNDHGMGRSRWIADGIRWAVDEGAHIISMSLGAMSESPQISSAVEYAIENNVIVIAAAGNSGEGEDTIGWPGHNDGVITVGSIRRGMERSSFSSTGATLEIMAPGEDVLSCYPDNKYATLSGTSMACPFIAGVAALILGRDLANGFDLRKYEGCTAAEYMTECLIQCATDIEDEGFDNETGWGIVNPEKSLRYKK
jgi:subtilisin family serine protease